MSEVRDVTQTTSLRLPLTYALIVWTCLAVIVVALDGPTFLRLIVVTPVTMFGVGAALALALDMYRGAIGICIAVTFGLASLVLASEVVLYAHYFSANLAFVIQVLAIAALSAVSLRNGKRQQRRAVTG